MNRGAWAAPALMGGVVAATLFVRTPSAPQPPAAAAPRPVTVADFCAGFDKLSQAYAAFVASPSPDATATLRARARATADLARGVEMDDRARAGLVFVVTAFLDLDDQAAGEDLQAADVAATLQDDANADALVGFLGANCQ